MESDQALKPVSSSSPRHSSPNIPRSLSSSQQRCEKFEKQLISGDIDGLAKAWQVDTLLAESGERAQHAAARRSVENQTPAFHEMYHALMHSNYWRPLVAQENKYAANLHERNRLGTALLTRVQAAQRIEFATFVRMEYENMLLTKKIVRKQESQDFREEDVDFLMDEGDLSTPPARRETGYTVHLGGQLKKIMNVRLMAGETMTFLQRETKLLAYDPIRLQTCMSLYSNTLQGLVLIIDEWDNYGGMWKDLAVLCAQWPELHFQGFEDQVSEARGLKEHWESGDVIATKHSGLREVQVLFHLLVTGNKMDLLQSEEVNGRHPAVLALRTVMRIVWESDVSVITIPLFLFRQFQASFMTSGWCQKRAELIFKCVKGYMIEMSSLADEQPKTVQFLMPDNTPDHIYAEMAEMITAIFRAPNPFIRLSD